VVKKYVDRGVLYLLDILTVVFNSC